MTVFRRADWGGGDPGGSPLTGPLADVFIHHTVGNTPASVDEALAEVYRIYVDHTSPSASDPSKPWSDIGYSWLVDDAGNCYEGRGWLRSGAHTEGHNSTAHAICWMGNSMVRRPSNSALACIAQLIVDGQKAGAVDRQPSIYGHRDVNSTACPGDGLYDSLPAIRMAVVGELNPQPHDTSGEEDDMTPDDRKWLQDQLNAVTGAVTTNAAYLGQWAQGLAAEHRQILDRLAQLEAAEVPTAAEIAAELLKQMGVRP